MNLGLPDQDDLIVACDTEGSGLHPDDGARLSTVQVAWSGGSQVFWFDQGQSTWLGPKALPRKYPGPSLFEVDQNLGDAEWWELTGWLRRQRLVFHNAQHDLHMIQAGLRNRPDTGVDLSGSYWWDTMVVAPLLWPNDKVSLDYLGALVLHRGKQNVDRIRSWRRKYLPPEAKGRYDLIPNDILGPYAQQDPELTLGLYWAEVEMIEEGLASWEAVAREIDLALVLYHMRRNGIGFDVAACRRQDQELRMAEVVALDKVARAVGEPRPTEDTMRRYWFTTLGLEPPKTTDKGQAAVSADVVRSLADQGIPGAAEWQTLPKIRTARKMWYGPWAELAGDDGRLRTVYRQCKSANDLHDDSGDDRGTRSGRLAVERVQLQAIPHDYQIPSGVVPVRKLFRARPGFVVVEVDVSQAEMRAVAGLAKCHALLARFANGEDAHDATCELVFGIDRSDPGWDFHRNVSKRLNFGIVYGAGVETLREQILQFTGYEATAEEVAVWWGAAKRSMPEIFAMSAALRRQADATRQVPLVGGRIRYFAPYEYTHKAMNARIQGSVAVAMADAMIEIVRQFGPDVLLLQIHDSVVFEVPADQAHWATSRIQQIICTTFQGHFGVPFKADAKVWHDNRRDAA
jgi:DNA polymerase I-like protein with 3'-5' exonuclease and polymerase domains